MSLNKLGDFLASRGGAGDADRAYQQYEHALELSEDLLTRNPNSAQAAREVMVSHYKLGELDARLQHYESAVARFTAGVNVLDAIVAKGLNKEGSASEKAILLRRIRECNAAPLATGDWDGILKSDPTIMPGLLTLRVTLLAQRGRRSDVAQAGAKLRELEPRTPYNLYNAACAYGLCAELAAKDESAPEQDRETGRRTYVALALACLKEAIKAGFKDFDPMRRDDDLKALHGMQEFEALFPKSAAK